MMTLTLPLCRRTRWYRR